MAAEPIHLTVEITFDDYVEAAKALQSLRRRLNMEGLRASNRRPLWPIVLSVLLVVLVAVLLESGLDPMPGVRAPFYTVFTLLFPAVAIALAVVAILSRLQSSRETRRSQKGSSGTWGRHGAWWLLFIALLAVFVLLQGRRPDDTSATQVDWYGMLVPHVMWVLVIAIGTITMMSLAKRQYHELWEAQPRLRRPIRFEIREDGVSCDDHVSRRQYQWLGFTRFLETQNLLMLCPSDLTFELLPKRCFASTEEMEAARALFEAQIVPPEKAPFAFPVGEVAGGAVESERAPS